MRMLNLGRRCVVGTEATFQADSGVFGTMLPWCGISGCELILVGGVMLMN